MLRYVVDFVKTSLECVCAAVVFGVVVAVFIVVTLTTLALIYKMFLV